MMSKHIAAYFSILVLLFCFSQTASAQTYTPVSFDVECEDGVQGSEVCVRFRVRDFVDVQSLQFTIAFNSTVLRFRDPVDVNNSLLTDVSVNNFATFNSSSGVIGFIYDAFGRSLTIPDGGEIFTICFDVIGQPGATGIVTITGNFIPVEVSQGVPADIPFLTQNINVDDCFVTVQATEFSIVTGFCDTSPVPGATDGSINFYFTGGTPPYNYTVTGPVSSSGSSGENERVNISNLPAGNYTVDVTDATGRTLSRLIRVTDNFPITFDITGRNPSCVLGVPNGFVAIEDLDGGLSPYTIEWSNVRYNLQRIEELPNGIYTVTVTDANGCSATDSWELDMDTLRVTLDIVQNAYCAESMDGIIRVNVMGGTPFPAGDYRVQLNTTPPQFGNPVTFNNVRPGTFRIRVRDNALPVPCEIEIDPDPFMPFDNTPVIIPEEIRNVVCRGQSNGEVRFRAESGAAYRFELRTVPGLALVAGTNNTTIFQRSNLPVGNYVIIAIENGFNCRQEFPFSISEAAEVFSFVDRVIQNPTCNGNDGQITVNFTGGVTPYTYAWSTGGSTTNVLSNINGGQGYEVTVTDANGCSLVQIIDFIPEGGDITVTPVVVRALTCSGRSDATVSVTSNLTNNVTYSWTNAQGTVVGTTQMVANLPAGTYTVQVTSEGCTASSSVTVVDPETLTLTDVTITPPLCPTGGFTGSIGITPQGGAPAYQYNWANTPNGPSIGNNSVLASIQPGTYFLTVTDQNGCSNTTSVTMDPVPFIQVSVGNILPVNCFNTATGQAFATASGGTVNNGNYSFTWSSSPLDFGINVNSNLAENLRPGRQWLIVADQRCATDTIFFEVPNAPNIDLLQSSVLVQPSCTNDCNGSINLIPTQGNGAPYTITWQDQPIIGSNRTNLCAGTYPVVVVDRNNCIYTDSIILSEPFPFAISIDSTFTRPPSCNTPFGQIGILSSGGNPGPLTFQWSPSVSTAATALNLDNGLYSVTVTDSRNCQDTLSYRIQGADPIAAVIPQPEEPACFGEETCISIQSVTGGIGNNYTFSVNRGPRNAIGDCVPVLAGNYIINVFDAEGCDTEYFVNITQPEPLNVFIGSDFTLDLGQSSPAIVPSVSSVFPIVSYQWSPQDILTCNDSNCSSVVAMPSRNTSVRLTIVDSEGCTAFDELNITVSNERRVYFPTLFSPNSADPKNTYFFPVTGFGVESILDFRVYDRWGNLMYSNPSIDINGDYTQGWNGRVGNTGEELQPGVFVYLVRVRFLDERELDYTGSITLLR